MYGNNIGTGISCTGMMDGLSLKKGSGEWLNIVSGVIEGNNVKVGIQTVSSSCTSGADLTFEVEWHVHPEDGIHHAYSPDYTATNCIPTASFTYPVGSTAN